MNKPARIYILITFFITWSLVLTSYIAFKHHRITFGQLNMVYNFGALGPFLSAVISSWIFEGWDGLTELFLRLRFRKSNYKAVIISLLPVLFLVMALIAYPFMSGKVYTFEVTRKQFNLNSNLSYVYWLLPFITYSIFEEFGWRGFLLPQLQARHTAFVSTLILTLFWATWHLPFFLWRFQFSVFITIGFFFSIFVGSLIITSIFNLSKGSITPVIIFHFCNNASSALDKQYIPVITGTCFVFLAIYLITKYKGEDLADVNRTTI